MTEGTGKREGKEGAREKTEEKRVIQFLQF